MCTYCRGTYGDGDGTLNRVHKVHFLALVCWNRIRTREGRSSIVEGDGLPLRLPLKQMTNSRDTPHANYLNCSRNEGKEPSR